MRAGELFEKDQLETSIISRLAVLERRISDLGRIDDLRHCWSVLERVRMYTLESALLGLHWAFVRDRTAAPTRISCRQTWTRRLS